MEPDRVSPKSIGTASSDAEARKQSTSKNWMRRGITSKEKAKSHITFFMRPRKNVHIMQRSTNFHISALSDIYLW